MKSQQLGQLYLDYFRSQWHAVIGNASLIPENDSSVLFVTAGMQPLVPYLLGERHPVGRRLVNIQNCLRTDDIEEVGDSSHLTFFQMLGNWSLGDYFREESIRMSYEFLFSPRWLNFNPKDFAFTVFEGDEHCPADEVSADIWKSLGISPSQLFYKPAKDNWWGPAGKTGPCGPDTEIFIDTKRPACSDSCSPGCDCGKYLEVWNNVFMEFAKNPDGSFSALSQRNVDTGMGFERMLCILNGTTDVYETDLFKEIISCISSLSSLEYQKEPETTKAFRIIADHVRSSVFLLADPSGIRPSNTEQGYILRRLIRRTVRYLRKLGLDSALPIAQAVIRRYGEEYPELDNHKEHILAEIKKEEERFSKTLEQGTKEFYRLARRTNSGISGVAAFRLYDTYGFPLEMTAELATEEGLSVDVEGFQRCYEEHQAKSRQGSGEKFACGLADQSDHTTRLHTATHLLQAALRTVLGSRVQQKGSSITPERLRFDFSFERKMTEDELQRTEALVNEVIQRNLPILCREMPLKAAQDEGAVGLFENRYGEVVKVYAIGEFSKEICGGPHAQSTGGLGVFRILKEESCSAGIRRIKAILERPGEKSNTNSIYLHE